MPNTPDDGEREPSQDPVEGEGEGQHHRFDPDSHDHFPDNSLTDLPKPTNPGDLGDWFLKQLEPGLSEEGFEEETKDLEAARKSSELHAAQEDAAAQKDAVDSKPWASSSGTSFYLTMPDGTLKHVSGDDFEDAETVQPRLEDAPWHRALMIGGALGVLGVLAALFFLLNGGEADTQTLDTTAVKAQESAETPTQEETVEETNEPLSAVAPTETAEGFVAASIDCRTGTQHDAIGNWPSPKPGEEVKEVAEIAAVTPADEAFNLQCSGFGFGSYVFTMIVEGDAETVFVADGTTFDLRFVVNSTWPLNVFEDDTGFTVFVVWNRQAAVYVGRVSDSDGTPVQDATVDIVWLDPSTLEATVTLPGDDIDVRSVRTELLGLIQDEQERTIAQYFDVAIWFAEP